MPQIGCEVIYSFGLKAKQDAIDNLYLDYYIVETHP